MRESKIEKALREGVEDRGGLCLKFVSPGRSGAPDRIVICHWLGYIIFVETKAPKGRLRASQKRFHEALVNQNQYIRVLYTLQQVREFLVSL